MSLILFILSFTGTLWFGVLPYSQAAPASSVVRGSTFDAPTSGISTSTKPVADKGLGEQNSNIIPNATIYAYTSREEETDSSPTITASGGKVHVGIVANNCQPFGTKIAVCERSGSIKSCRVYTVTDRMAAKYGCEVFDVWHEDLQEALAWGKQTREVIVLSATH